VLVDRALVEEVGLPGAATWWIEGDACVPRHSGKECLPSAAGVS
jgi:hypothetical protein